MTDREAMERALDMLKQAKDAVADWGAYASEYFQHKHNLQGSIDDIQAQITVLSERLAQPAQQPEQEPEPVGEMRLSEIIDGMVLPVVTTELPVGTKLYTAPPQRKPLTKDEIRDGARKIDPGGEDLCSWSFECGVRFAELALGIKGDA